MYKLDTDPPKIREPEKAIFSSFEIVTERTLYYCQNEDIDSMHRKQLSQPDGPRFPAIVRSPSGGFFSRY
jgi:hypothetical protein